MSLSISLLAADNHELHRQIADWYFQEWKLPKYQTLSDLAGKDNDKVIFQLIAKNSGKVLGTGGLYRRVGVQQHAKQFEHHSPWIGLLYTIAEVRGQGFGAQLLSAIEQEAFKRNHPHLYLFTNSAASLYKRQNWTTIESIEIRGRQVVIMEKVLLG